jgi:hypothetical protein
LPKARSLLRICVLLASAATLMAAPSIATVTSAVAFVLDGHAMAAPGVTSFPVVAGDTVATSGGPAVLLFPDGSRVKLGQNSSVEVDADAGLKVVLLVGSLDFTLVPGSHLRVMNLDAFRKQSSNENTHPSAPGKPHVHVSTSLGKPGFILFEDGSAPGATAGLLSFFGSESASKAASATSIVHIPPVSRHL